MSLARRTLAAGLALVALAAGGSAPAQTQTPSTIPSDEEIFRHVEDLVAFSPRRVGSPGIEKTVDYIGRKFKSYGLQRVHVEEVPTYSWEALDHGLTFGGERIDASPVIYSQSPSRSAVGEQSTPPGGLTAPLVDIRGARADEVARHDVRGKIAIFDLNFLLPVAGLLPFSTFLWDPDGSMLNLPTLLTANPYLTNFTEAVKAAQDAGAVGFVGILGDYFESNRYYNEFYRRQIVSIPGLWVTRNEGARLRALAAHRPAEQATMVLRSKREKVPSHVVVGYLDGKSTDAIQIHSHHDSGFEGAVEDASGVAEVLALARHYSRQPASSREKTLMFTTFDSHWSGYDAHNAFLKRHVLRPDPKRAPNRIVADVTLEHIAKHALRGADGSLQVTDKPEPRGVFENLSLPLKTQLISSIRRHGLTRTAVLNASVLQPVGIPTDSSGWVLLGIPTASLISGPMYLYDAADTVDKVLKDELHEVAAAFAELIDAMDRTPSDQLGLLPPPVAELLGQAFAPDPGTIPDSVDREIADEPAAASCRPARKGKAIRDAQVTRTRKGLRLGFRARRSLTVRVTAVTASGRRRALKARRITACRRVTVALPRGTRRAEVRWRGGVAKVRVPAARRR